jgi:cytochrome c oxidase assembly factor CtaG
MLAPPPATDPASAALQLGPLALLAVLYARRARTLARQRQGVPAWRQASWFGALALIALSLTLLGSGSQELLVLHMAEHLLIGDVAAILIVLGLTGPLLAPVLRISFFNRLRALSNPVIALPLWVLDLYVWHLPVFYEAALRNGGVHALEHVLFIAFGVNLWMCLLGPLPVPSWFDAPRKAIYLLGYWFAGTLLANTFIWIGTPFYSYYASGDASSGISQLADQKLAGAIMMIEGTIVTLCVGGWLLATALREAGERQELVEFASARGVSLSAERAGRAVRAGRAAELRTRLETDPSEAGGPGEPVAGA